MPVIISRHFFTLWLFAPLASFLFILCVANFAGTKLHPVCVGGPPNAARKFSTSFQTFKRYCHFETNFRCIECYL